MSSTFSIALSALQAQSEAINATSNNLANVNTVGFKGSNVDFQDALSQSLSGVQIGMGVSKAITVQQFSQGSLQSSSSPLAAAIEGDGFFVLKGSSGQQMFTRDGDFTLDSSGVLKTQTGESVQGWMADSNGNVSSNGALTNISLPVGQVLPPKPTGSLSISANLNSATDATSPNATFSVPIQVVDSLGSMHTLTMSFTKSSSTPDTWSYQVTIPGADVNSASSSVSVAGPGTLTFNSDGTLNTTGITSPVSIAVNGLADGAANMSINWNLLNPDGTGALTQFAQTSALSSSTQDGAQAAELSGFSVEQGGNIVATFSNGQTKVEAQLALAGITNPTSLENAGNNNFIVSGDTATPVFGAANTGGRGQIESGQIEGSNVDLAAQFSNLIVYQSAYQASSKIITTADQMTQELLSLIH